MSYSEVSTIWDVSMKISCSSFGGGGIVIAKPHGLAEFHCEKQFRSDGGLTARTRCATIMEQGFNIVSLCYWNAHGDNMALLALTA